MAEAETDVVPHFKTFSEMLSEEKDRFAMIAKDTAARFAAWKQATLESWPHSWAEINRSAVEALDRLRDWIAKRSVSDEQTETRV